MAVTFPSSPVNGQTYSANGQQYTYNAEAGLWDIAATPATSTTAGGITMSDSAPSNPAVGDQWFNTELLETYVWYSDVHGSYWVKSNPTGATENVDVPTDINDLTDTSGVIPSDISDLTDSTSLLGSSSTTEFTSTVTLQGVKEKTTTITPNVNPHTLDCSASHIFVMNPHQNPNANVSVDLINLSMNANESTAISILADVGPTAWHVGSLRIDGVAQTINWQGGSLYTPTASGYDLVTFSIFYDGTTYTVLGQAGTYG